MSDHRRADPGTLRMGGQYLVDVTQQLPDAGGGRCGVRRQQFPPGSAPLMALRVDRPQPARPRRCINLTTGAGRLMDPHWRSSRARRITASPASHRTRTCGSRIRLLDSIDQNPSTKLGLYRRCVKACPRGFERFISCHFARTGVWSRPSSPGPVSSAFHPAPFHELTPASGGFDTSGRHFSIHPSPAVLIIQGIIPWPPLVPRVQVQVLRMRWPSSDEQ